MPLDPGLDALLQAMLQHGLMGFAASSPQRARAGFRAVTADARPDSLVIGVGSVEDGELPGPAGPLRFRVYRPDSTPAQAPTVLFLHGGGWVIGDLDTHDNQARRICREVGAVVVSLEYRLAPEHSFPAAVEDTWTALRWLADAVQEGGFGADPRRVAVAGDSAGATLATVAARRARDAGGPAVAAQLLLYPGTDFAAEDAAYPSRVENGQGKLLTLRDVHWFAEHYLAAVDGAPPPGLDLTDPDLSPLHAQNLGGLAPAVVVTAEFDPLRDEGNAYAAALQKAGTPVLAECAAGMTHGFFDLGPISPAVDAAAQRACAKFRELLVG